MFKTNKQMYLKYIAENKDFIYSQLRDDDLDAYKKKLKNTQVSGETSMFIHWKTLYC